MSFSSISPAVGRFAPSPTGPLHFGSLVAAVGSYCLARREGGRWLLRMDDLDQPRVQLGAGDEILRTLEGLGFCWDGEILWQSRRQERYRQALEELRRKGLVFDCGCSRREILASAPHPGEEGPVYPGTCRAGLAPGRRPRAERLRVPKDAIGFCDGLFGNIEQHLLTAVGDFVLRRADGIFAYQLAVVVDDADCGVNQVVRGVDLLGSTPRQVYLYNCFGWPVPRYVHLPLALGPDGQKLSKRHGSVSLAGRKGGAWLFLALQFLGQVVPGELASDSPRIVLDWACKNFDLSRVPRVDREFCLDCEGENRTTNPAAD